MQSDFRHEHHAIERIRDNLKLYQDLKVFNNLHLYEKHRHGWLETDIIIAHEHFLYIVELKEWQGDILVRNERWQKDGTGELNPHILNNKKCKKCQGTRYFRNHCQIFRVKRRAFAASGA